MNKTNAHKSGTDRIWAFFASVKLSVVLLLTLAVTSIIGTVIPQNENPALYRQTYGDGLYQLFDTLNFFDMYHAWWFRLLLCLLIVNIVVCSIQRLSSTWKILFPKKPVFNANQFRKSPNRNEWVVTDSMESLKEMYAGFMEKHFRHSRVQAQDNGYMIFGEKGRWTRLGVYAVHSSILLLMVGGLIGSIYGFEGYMNVPEGATASTISLKNADRQKPLDFTIRCDDFTVSHYPSGRPKQYRSEIAIIDNDEVVMEKSLRVNDPIHYKGINIFQSSYGKTPGEKFSVVFTDNSSGMEVKRQASVGDEIALPADSGKLVVEDFTNNFNFRGHNIGPSFLSRLIPKEGDPRPIILPVNHPRFDKMRRGDYTITLEDVEYRHYTGLQITRDPGVPVVYAGFVIMIIGCYITFFMFHKKICIELAPAGKEKTTVTVSGLSPKNRPGMKNMVNRIARRLDHLRQNQNQSL
ncbi:MAG: cytochrome c biogenesis protein ResB [Thermodesulfobacteriota bacterium]